MTTLKKILLTVFIVVNANAIAQEFDINLQLRPRFEFRNGFKSPLLDTEEATSFISQRSRLNLAFHQERLTAKLSVQDIRTWGDAATTATAGKNGLAVFEAWAKYHFNENWSTTLGRQVLSYDNERIMGGIDWLQQGQSHDAVLVTNKKNGYQLDFGAALNNNNEALYESAYVTNYKNMQFIWFNQKFSKLSLSFLALNNGYQYENLAENKFQVAYLQTIGTYGKWDASKFYGDFGLYAQTGEAAITNDKVDVGAYYAGFNLGYKFTNPFKAELGFEYLSGKDQNDTDTKVKSFTPLFGTNHGFNGLMDYFYVGNHKNSVGLQDFYTKFIYDKNKWQVTLSPHLFYSAASVYNMTTLEEQDSYLGTEIDLTATYKLDKNFVITGGVSKMFASDTMEVLKGGNNSNDNNWAWVMISFNPQLFTYKK